MSLPVETFHSEHFQIQPLSEGVFAAIAEIGGAAISNAGIIDLGQHTLIYDTFMTPQAALDLRRAAEHLTGRDPDIIINSHYHNDHIWGNQAFHQNATIISSAATLQLIQTEGLAEIQWARESSPQRLADLRRQLDAAGSEQQRQDLRMWLGYWQALVDNLPALQVRLPDITFEKRLTFRGSVRTAELIPFAGAHSGDDAVLHLPAENIVFAADLLFVNCHPYLAEGDPSRLLEVIADIAALKAVRLVPGHGPVGTPQDLAVNSAYITHCLNAAKELAAGGEGAAERIEQLPIPEAYSSWGLSNFYAANLKALVKKLSRE